MRCLLSGKVVAPVVVGVRCAVFADCRWITVLGLTGPVSASELSDSMEGGSSGMVL